MNEKTPVGTEQFSALLPEFQIPKQPNTKLLAATTMAFYESSVVVEPRAITDPVRLMACTLAH